MIEAVVEPKITVKEHTAIDTQEKRYTVAEYFELEKHSPIRHEFYYGKLIAMPGESKKANIIAGNCYITFRQSKPLKEQGFFVFIQDVRTIVKDDAIYRYPDVVVADTKDDNDTHNIKSPRILVEVISDNSKYRDRVTKLKEYSKIPTLDYYVIIDQDEVNVEVYSRKENGWHYQRLEDMSDLLDLPLFDMSLSLETIYEDIVLTEAGHQSDEEEV
jgi:Uma2 family endonuclease